MHGAESRGFRNKVQGLREEAAALFSLSWGSLHSSPMALLGSSWWARHPQSLLPGASLSRTCIFEGDP